MLLRILSNLHGNQTSRYRDRQLWLAMLGRTLVLFLVLTALAAMWWYGLTVESDYPSSAT